MILGDIRHVGIFKVCGRALLIACVILPLGILFLLTELYVWLSILITGKDDRTL